MEHGFQMSLVFFLFGGGLRGVALLDPGFVEVGVFDGFSGGVVEVVAVGGVEGAVLGLHDAGVMIAGAFGGVFEVAFPGPGFAFVGGDLDGEAVAAAFGVVADEGPVAVLQVDDFGAGAGVGMFAVGDFGPSFAAIGGGGLEQAFRRGAVVAHEGVEGAVALFTDAGLDVAEAEERGAGVPVDAPVVGDGHKREGEAVGVKWDDEAFAIEDEGMGAGHPAEALVEFVGGVTAHVIEPGAAAAVFFRDGIEEGMFFEAVEPLEDLGVEVGVVGSDVDDFVLVPFGRAVAAPVGGDADFEEGGLPGVGEDGGPDEPEAAFGIDEHRAVGVGIVEGVGHGETFAPSLGTLFEAGAFDLHVVSGAFAGALEPADEEVAIGLLDDAGSVAVPMFGREDKFADVEWFLRRRVGSQRQKEGKQG